MRFTLLAAALLAAALTLTAAPADAQHVSVSGVPHFKSADSDGGRRFHRGTGRCRDGGCAGVVAGWAYDDGGWAVANNRSWAPDSFNDWWHDRPDRAFPRWVQEQRARGTCDPDRLWWSGSGWHC